MPKSFVVHVREDIAKANGRDPEATKLIDLAKTFGTVETLDSALSAEKAKHQVVINNLSAQYEAEITEKNAYIASIEEKNVTEAELKVLRVMREKEALEKANYEAEIAIRDEQLKAIQVENENRAAAIKAMYGF